MKITVFTPANEGLADPDYPTVVYEGHLTEDQILRAAEELGQVKKLGSLSYQSAIVEANPAWDGAFKVTYQTPADLPGDLSYSVERTETRNGGLA